MGKSTSISSTGRTGLPEEEIIFSLRDGYVWASWPDTHATVRLGRHETVAAMMEDFLAQDAIGQRLTTRPQPWVDPH